MPRLLLITLMTYLVISNSAHAESTDQKGWSGTYVGVSLGSVKADANTNAFTNIGGSNYFTSPDDVQISQAGSGSLSQSNLGGGIFVGLQEQYGSLLIGLEASADVFSYDEVHSNTVTFTSVPTAQFTLSQAIEADWQSTLRLRLGYAWTDWLAYITGGVAVTEVKTNISYSDNYGAGGSGHGNDSETKVGWTLGMGGEYAINKSWAIKGQYLYSDFGSVDTKAAVENPSNLGQSSIITSSVDFKTYMLSIGILYRF